MIIIHYWTYFNVFFMASNNISYIYIINKASKNCVQFSWTKVISRSHIIYYIYVYLRVEITHSRQFLLYTYTRHVVGCFSSSCHDSSFLYPFSALRVTARRVPFWLCKNMTCVYVYYNMCVLVFRTSGGKSAREQVSSFFPSPEQLLHLDR